MRSLITVLLDSSNYGRRSLIWSIRRVIAEHMHMDELDEADKLFGKHTVEDAKKAEVLLDELRKNQYLQPACIRMGTIYSFINGD